MIIILLHLKIFIENSKKSRILSSIMPITIKQNPPVYRSGIYGEIKLGQENYQKSVFKTQQKEGFATSSTPANNF
jgi:hypothetical protein